MISLAQAAATWNSDKLYYGLQAKLWYGLQLPGTQALTRAGRSHL